MQGNVIQTMKCAELKLLHVGSGQPTSFIPSGITSPCGGTNSSPSSTFVTGSPLFGGGGALVLGGASDTLSL